MTNAGHAAYRFYSPSQLIAGDGASDQVGPLLDSWALPKGAVVTLVVDADVLALGLAKTAQDSIAAAGFHAEVIACPPGEPKLAGVEGVVADLRRLKPVACVGLGGGSTMDVAKLAAALVTNAGAVTDFLGLNKIGLPSIPTILIPTTAGTGSEATQVAMLSVHGKKAAAASQPMMARAAILDPSLIVGLPQSVTASSGLDALSHAFESYLSTTANNSTRGASVHGARLIAESIKAVFADGSNKDMRMAMLTGAYWSGIGLNASVVLGHSMAYTIANRTGLPHGVTCSMALPYCLAYNEKASATRIESLASALREQINPGSTSDSDPTGIYGWLAELEKDLGVPASLQDVGIGKSDLAGMVEECISSYPRANNPVPFDAKSLGRLYEHLFEGDIEGSVATFRQA